MLKYLAYFVKRIHICTNISFRIEKKDNNGVKYIGVLRVHHIREFTRCKTGEKTCLNKWKCPNSVYVTTKQGESQNKVLFFPHKRFSIPISNVQKVEHLKPVFT